jgi:cation diffusion facilitator family transporter
MTVKTTEVLDAARADREKRLVAASSVAAAVLLTAMKVAVGFATGSIGILSEAAHSGLDLVAAAVTLWAVRASAAPADRDHPYGHGKIENFSALFETGLLLSTCAWIVYESVKRLLEPAAHVEATPWAFAVMAISIAVDISRSRALARAARKHRSQALEADALHFSTDVWSSSVVIAGLVAVWCAERFQLPWLARADAVAALGVAGIAVVVSLRLGKKSVDDLLDAAPPDLLARVAAAARVGGVLGVSQVRMRSAGPAIFADVTLEVARGLDLDEGHEIAHRAEVAIREVVPDADVVVHAHPADGPLRPELLEAVGPPAGRGLRLEEIRVVLRWKDDPAAAPGGAADQAAKLEADLRERFPQAARIRVGHEAEG